MAQLGQVDRETRLQFNYYTYLFSCTGLHLAAMVHEYVATQDQLVMVRSQVM